MCMSSLGFILFLAIYICTYLYIYVYVMYIHFMYFEEDVQYFR